MVVLIFTVIRKDYILPIDSFFIDSRSHQPLEKLEAVTSEMSVKKCVAVDISHIMFW